MRYLGLVAAIALSLAATGQDFADYAYEAPLAAKHVQPAAMSALPTDAVQRYTRNVDQLHVFTPYLGMNNILKAEQSDLKVFQIGAGFATDMTGIPLFGAGVAENGETVYSAAIASADATGLRIIVDLSGLKDGERVFVVDATSNRAFGPYTRADHVAGGRWLPVTDGDTAVLVARTAHGTAPAVDLVGVSHFFRSAAEIKAALSCNNDINCEGDSTIQTLSSGVGIMVIPQGNFDSGLCSGALINNADTPENEPYYLTAWHCVPDYASPTQVDILWDFRTSGCNANDPPSFSSLPRSNGSAVVASNSSLDMTLMLLDNVPGGPSGRAYLGWETRAPNINENVVDIHFPRGEYMRISYGQVKAINQGSSGFTKQTFVDWTDGVTEGGSSGSPLLLAASAYRITGTLSNGPTHSCTDTRFNNDYFASFRDFFPTVESYLKGTNPGPIPAPGNGGGLCPAASVFKNNPEALEALRAFRDETLRPSAMGQHLVDAYYQAAPWMADLVETSPLAADAFRAASTPFVRLGAGPVQSAPAAGVAPVSP